MEDNGIVTEVNPIDQAENLPPELPLISGRQELMRTQTEIHGQLLAARQFPRSLTRAYQEISTACSRYKLAEKAHYQYKRGGKPVRGPTIVLIRELARLYGNIDYGMREIERRNGSSVFNVWAADLETNTRQSRTIVIKHVRQAEGREYNLTNERDIYEMNANMATRRMRECIRQILPYDLCERASEKCIATLSNPTGEKKLVDRIQSIVLALSEYGVTEEMIERTIGRKISELDGHDFASLVEKFQALKSGEARAFEIFETNKVSNEGNAQAIEQRIDKTINKPVDPKPTK